MKYYKRTLEEMERGAGNIFYDDFQDLIEKPRPSKKRKIKPSDSDYVDLETIVNRLRDMPQTARQIDMYHEIISEIVKIKDHLPNKEKICDLLLSLIHDFVKTGNADFILLKHEAARDLYQRYRNVLDDMKLLQDDCDETERHRKSALSKLTDKEKAALGIE